MNTKVLEPPAPQKTTYNSNACKIYDLQAFVFLVNHQIFLIFRSIGTEFGELKKQS